MITADQSAPTAGEADVVIIGGGIAGVGLAGHLAPAARVVLLEREEAVGYHSSGRSAALYIEPYSNWPVFALTRGSRDFLLAPPGDFTEVPLAAPRGALTLAPAGQQDELGDFIARWQPACPAIREIDLDEAARRLPVLIPGYAKRAAFDPEVYALDTDAMMQGWLRQLRRHGGELLTGAEVTALTRDPGGWSVTTNHGVIRTSVVVNAAGAWAGRLAELAGALRVPLQPRRRSAALVAAPAGMDVDGWPVVADVAHTFYFKPEAGALMLSPADATPSEPCDARPEEMDLAVAVARAEEAADLGVRRFVATWAGLRNFVPDEVPVYGFDPSVPGFYWAAAQGGTGFQTAPAAARWMAAEILGTAPPDDLLALGLESTAVAPGRFA